MNVALGVLALAAWSVCIAGVLRQFRRVHRDIRRDEAAREQRGLP